MRLPVRPPVAPMLALPARGLPAHGYLYEPKWDGFRALVFRDRDDVDLRSRNDRPLARHFPEVVEALLALPEERFALDGELVVTRDGALDFAALLRRIHPAAPVDRLRSETPAAFIAFDVLAVGRDDVCGWTFAERRRLLATLLGEARPPLHLTPLTDDPDVASDWLERFQGSGIDGVVAKHVELRYEPGARRMVKVKTERTAECVVTGFRWEDDRPAIAALLLGLYDDEQRLHQVGAVGSLHEAEGRELREQLVPLATGETEAGWVAVAPERVVEVAYDHVDEGRFRHEPRWVRRRPDRDPESCTLEQLLEPAEDLAALLAS